MMSTFAQRLATLDLTTIMARVVAEQGLTADQAPRAEQQYRDFLTLKAAHPDRLISPTKLADLVWHEHITHTRKYMADCDMLFGAYLHHTPMQQTDAEVAEICGLYTKTFGYNPGLYGTDTPIYQGLAGCAS